MRRITSRWLAGGAVAAAAALALTACGSGFNGGSGSSDTGKLTSSDKALTVMIGSSGDAETAAVKSAVSDWSKSSGTKASVVAASDLNQQLSQGFAAKKPADVFYLSTDALAGYASNGSLLAYGDQLSNKSDFYPLRAQGLLDAAAHHQQGPVERRRPDRQRHPQDLGPAGGRLQEADRRRPRRSRHLRRVRPRRLLHGAGRRQLDERRQHQGDREQRRQRQGARLRQADAERRRPQVRQGPRRGLGRRATGSPAP